MVADVFDKVSFGRPSVLGIALALFQLLMVLVPRLEVVCIDAPRLHLKTVLLFVLVRGASLPGLPGQTRLLRVVVRLSLHAACCGLIERFHGMK